MANNKKWGKFEKDCYQYIKDTFGEYAEFEDFGESDSTRPDILVLDGRTEFFIEVKMKKSQAAQFVIFPDDDKRKYNYSQDNKYQPPEQSKALMRIIEEMNDNFDRYKHPEKGPITINPSLEKVFIQWIIDKYKHMGVRFVITNGYLIFPLYDFGDYFEVEGIYRIKKSGSGEPGKKLQSELPPFIMKNFNVIKVWPETTTDKNKKYKLFVSSEDKLDTKRFHYQNWEFMFSIRRGYEYEVRKLSNTSNPNVIFQLSLKKNHPGGLSKEQFIQYLLDRRR